MPDTKKLRFTCDNWLRVKGRGFCAVIKEILPEAYPAYYDPNQLVGMLVYINDELFRVSGAETCAIWRSEKSPYKLTFSLLVKEVKTHNATLNELLEGGPKFMPKGSISHEDIHTVQDAWRNHIKSKLIGK